MREYSFGETTKIKRGDPGFGTIETLAAGCQIQVVDVIDKAAKVVGVRFDAAFDRQDPRAHDFFRALEKSGFCHWAQPERIATYTGDKCPACGSGDVVPVAFGAATPENEARRNRGEVLLVFCKPDTDRVPTHGCRNCNAVWHRPE